MASDCSDGSTSVKISGQEVMLKNKSYFKKSTGDEAGSAPKKGVVTSKIMGKVYFNAWSMDVKVEGENVVRNLDQTTHNHGSAPGNSPVWPYLDSMTMAQFKACAGDVEREMTACANCTPYGKEDPCPPDPGAELSGDDASMTYSSSMLGNKCLEARRCMLSPYEPKTCCGAQTPHHLVEASAFHAKDRGFKAANAATGANVKIAGAEKYSPKAAPCICVEGTNHGVGTHGLMHTFQSDTAMQCPQSTFTATGGAPLRTVSDTGAVTTSWRATTLGEAQKSAAQAVSKTFPESKCSEGCIEAQLANYHEKTAGMSKDQPIKAVHTCDPGQNNRLADAESVVQLRQRLANGGASSSTGGAF